MNMSTRQCINNNVVRTVSIANGGIELSDINLVPCFSQGIVVDSETKGVDERLVGRQGYKTSSFKDMK